MGRRKPPDPFAGSESPLLKRDLADGSESSQISWLKIPKEYGPAGAIFRCEREAHSCTVLPQPAKMLSSLGREPCLPCSADDFRGALPLDCAECFDLSQKINLPKLPAPQKKAVMLRVAMHPENHQLNNVSNASRPSEQDTTEHGLLAAWQRRGYRGGGE